MNSRPWIHYYERGEKQAVLTFQDIDDHAGQIIAELVRLGIQPQDRVVVSLPNCPYAVSVYMACKYAGITAVPVSPDESPAYVQFVVNNCGARAVITLIGIHPQPQIDERVSRRLAQTIIYTSGTTGAPKGVCLGTDQWNHNATLVNIRHGVTPDTVHASPLPLYHVNAHGFSMIATRMARCKWVLFDRVDEHTLNIVNQESVEILSLVPALVYKLLRLHPDWKPHKGFKYIVTAAAALPGSLLKTVMEQWGVRIVQGYGISESTNFTCVVPPSISDDLYRHIMFPNPSIGTALPGITVFVGDEDREGVTGEIKIRSSSNFLGYWGHGEPRDEWVLTGDLGYYVTYHLPLHGVRFYYITGRIKEQINRGGETISPVAIEESLAQLGLQGDFIIVSIPSPTLGEEIGLVTTAPFDEEILAQLPWQRRPKKWAIVPEIPRTSTGKPRRNEASRILS